MQVVYGVGKLDNNDDTDSIIDIQNIYNTRGPGLIDLPILFFQIIMFATIKRLFYLLLRKATRLYRRHFASKFLVKTN
jgi:hypothetical protein